MSHRFLHAPWPEIGYKNLETEEGKKGRFYLTPEGKFPSITTVLSIRSRGFLAEWRQRVGAEEANRISRRAATRGSKVHNLYEKYLNNEDIDVSKLMPHIRQNFLAVKKVLDERVSVIYAQETPLYSRHLGLAGRVDCVGVFDDKLSIIDFKTSGRVKTKEWVTDYFIQATAYAIMWEERTGMPITNLEIIMCVDNYDEALVFTEKRDNWTKELWETITEYRKDAVFGQV